MLNVRGTESLGLAACQSAPAPTLGPPNGLLTGAGFVVKRPKTPQQTALLNGLPANQIVKKTSNGKVTYLYADPAGCGCLHVGDQAAFKNLRSMQNAVQEMNSDALDPGLSINNIDNLDGWDPLL